MKAATLNGEEIKSTSFIPEYSFPIARVFSSLFPVVTVLPVYSVGYSAEEFSPCFLFSVVALFHGS